MESDREKWLNGHQRHGGMVYPGHGRCAGCGRDFGVGCIVIDENDIFPEKEPDFPFNEETCPVCRPDIRIVPDSVPSLSPEEIAKYPLSVIRKALEIRKRYF